MREIELSSDSVVKQVEEAMAPKTVEELKDALSGYSRAGNLLFTGFWPENPCFDLTTGKLAEGVTAGNYFDSEPISDEEAGRLMVGAPKEGDR